MNEARREELLEMCRMLAESDIRVAVTTELIEAGRSSRGGWSDNQLDLLGISWPPQKGWKADAVGMRVAASQMIKFIEIRDEHL